MVLARPDEVEDGEDIGQDEQTPGSISACDSYSSPGRMNSPLNSRNGNKRLETMAIGGVAGAGAGDLSSQGNPATEPETHGDDLDGWDHELV